MQAERAEQLVVQNYSLRFHSITPRPILTG